MTIDQNINVVRQEFESFPDWEDRYMHIIALGKGLAPYNEVHLTDEFKVKGCQSQVWLHAAIVGGRVRFEAESDALIVKGLITILLRLFNDRTPKEILEAPSDLVARLGFEQHLSHSRANGVASVLKQVKLYALAYSMVRA